MTKPILWSYLETFSPTPIKHGSWKYAEKAELLLFPYAFGDGAPKCWDATDGSEMPAELYDALHDPEQEVGFFNGGMFDSVILLHTHGIDLPPNRILDVMVQSLSHAMPGGLDALCAVLGLGEDLAKNKDGKALIRLFCMPQKFSHSVPKDFGTAKERKAEIERLKSLWTGRATRLTHPEQWKKFIAYAMQDIVAMRAAHKRLPRWNYPAKKERDLWNIDQISNRRGVAIDVAFAEAAVRAAGRAKVSLAAQCKDETNGEVESATQRDALLEFILAEFGYSLSDMRKSTLERLLETPDLPLELRSLLEIRLNASATSVAKYQTLINGTSSDGRMRGTIQFCGAVRSKREGGRLVQVQNLARLNTKPISEWHGVSQKELTEQQIDNYLQTGIETTLADSEEFFFGDHVMPMLTNCIRGSFVAPKGKKLVVSDLSNIEGRYAAWITGETWKIQAFTDFDHGIGADLYKLAYAKAFDVDPFGVDKDQRQIGKLMELFLQFMGGAAAYATGANSYNIDLEKMAENAIEKIPSDVLREAESFMHWIEEKGGNKCGLSDRAYIVCESFKRLWRTAHPAISSYWKEIDAGVREAVNSPTQVVTMRKMKVQFIKGWLRMLCPDGSYLCYPQFRIENDGQFSFMEVNSFTRRWKRTTTHSGKLFNNIVQGGSRNVFCNSYAPAEEAGFAIVMRIHDELVTEVDDNDEHTVGMLSKIMSTVPEWAQGLPLAAAGYEATRYKKG